MPDGLTDAYYSVPVVISDWKYLLFRFGAIWYKYVMLAWRSFLCLKVFTKLLIPVLSALRKQDHQDISYLDNFFIVGDIFEECKRAVRDTTKLLTNLSFQIHTVKSGFNPLPKIECLGFVLNSKDIIVRIIQEKEGKIRLVINQKMVAKYWKSVKHPCQVSIWEIEFSRFTKT